MGELSEAPLSKPHTVALLCLAAAAAGKTKEAEVVKRKKAGGGEDTGKGARWGPPRAGRRRGVICQPPWAEVRLLHTRVLARAGEGLWTEVNGEEVAHIR